MAKIFLPGRVGFDPKQKPQQWGTPAEVRAAVWRNAERLGIDPKSIKAVYPMWEGAGNIVAPPKGPAVNLYNSPSWLNTGLRVGYIDSILRYAQSDETAPDLQSAITVFAQVTPVNDSSNGHCFVIMDRESDVQSDIQYEIRIMGDYAYEQNTCLHYAYRVGGSWHLWQKKYIGYQYGIPHSFSIAYRFGDGSSIVGMVDGEDVGGGLWEIGNGNSMPPSTSTRLAIGPSFYWTNFRIATSDIHFVMLVDGYYPHLDLHERPYALLESNPAPIWFDFGAGGGGGTLSLSTSWRLLTESQRNAAWNILTAEQLDTAWAILTSGMLSRATAWRILGSVERATAWHITDELSHDAAWRTFASDNLGTSWHILGEASHDTGWKVLTLETTDTAWNILETIAQETGWKIVNADDLDTAWRVFSDIPQPIKTFVAKSTTFAFNARTKTFVFVAKK